MKEYDVYLYGMVLVTNSFLLSGEFPKPDTYGDIKQRYRLPGGETGTCATVLSSLGCSVLMDGNHMGSQVYPVIKDFYEKTKVDISPLHVDYDYLGLEDYVVIDKNTRTPFGMFNTFYSDEVKRWNVPKAEDIVKAKVVAIDPFFQPQSEVAAQICVKENIPYVTIDCRYDSYLHQHASITVCSSELFTFTYPEVTDHEAMFENFVKDHDGLVIFTRGSKGLWYGRKNTGLKKLPSFDVDVVSTLGAGDTFKAGCVYGLLHGMEDDELVRFASATAAMACTRFPIPLNPPKLEEVMELAK